ncbi:zinc ribbon domain-containing protein [Slackia heliotrinireducens]|uniref:zinc ribbon domain-containing protein n=1 Tax=Slackia heliotrinireducens TaxID=84110 RepID=UPI0033153B14
MQATLEQLEALDKLQQVDSAMAKLQKQIDGLPQKQAILEVRHKIAELSDKHRSLLGMRKDAEADLEDLNAKDAEQQAKQVEAQRAIDEAKGDYRSVSTRTKALQNATEKREKIAAEVDALEQRILEMVDLEQNVASAVEKLNAREKQLISSYQSEGGELVNRLNAFKAARAKLAAAIGDDLAARYDRVAAAKQGVALAKLADGRCSVCRTAVDADRLLSVKREAPLSTCPNCGRLMVVGDDE